MFKKPDVEMQRIERVLGSVFKCLPTPVKLPAEEPGRFIHDVYNWKGAFSSALREIDTICGGDCQNASTEVMVGVT